MTDLIASSKRLFHQSFLFGYIAHHPGKLNKIPLVPIADIHNRKIKIISTLLTLLCAWVAMLEIFSGEHIRCSKQTISIPSSCLQRGRLNKIFYFFTKIFRSKSIEIPYHHIIYIKDETIHRVAATQNQYNLDQGVSVGNKIVLAASTTAVYQRSSSSQEDTYERILTICTTHGDYKIKSIKCQKEDAELILEKLFRNKVNEKKIMVVKR